MRVGSDSKKSQAGREFRRRGISAFFAFAILLPTLGWADLYLYPGSFDLFHITHESEARFLENRPGSKGVWIFPIEEAYYNLHSVTGVTRPPFTRFALRKTIIEGTLVDRLDRIQVRNDLRKISDNIFKTLSSLVVRASRESGESVVIYVGTDVLK